MDLGVPLLIRSDGGPQLASREFRDYLAKWGVTEGIERHTMRRATFMLKRQGKP